MSAASITDRVRELVEPLLTDRQLELVDVELGGGQLRLTVDRPGGVDLEAIGDATRVVSRALDEHDPVPGRYTLEVSSPGLERNLRTPAQFARAVGERVAVKVLATAEGDRRISGELLAAGDDSLVVRVDDGTEHHIAYDEVERARTVFEWPKPSRPEKKKVSK
jgi:ribosome maturation factor RimP